MEIDTETLILAVKKRPALYNKNDSNYYSHKKHKSRLWTEVCKEVFAGWEDFKPQNKVEYGHELQRRWKSLRTCFTRELALQRKEKLQKNRNEGPYRKRKRYEYFNMMSFLLDPEEENTNKDSEDDSSDPLDSVKNEPLLYETSAISSEPHFENSSATRFETAFTSRFENAASTRFEIETDPTHIRPMYERSENLEDKILDMLKEIKKDEEDEDRQFMLSLVPSFRKLKDKQKFEARIEILRVLKDITFKDDEFKMN